MDQPDTQSTTRGGAHPGGLWVAALLTVTGLAILISLGVWQLSRLQWKEGLQAAIDTRANAAAVTLTTAMARAPGGQPPRYSRVAIDATVSLTKPAYVYTGRGGIAGWNVFVPATPANGPVTPQGAPQSVLVNLGFIAAEQRDAFERALPSGTRNASGAPAAFEALVRHAGERPSVFTPDDDAARRRWYWPDIEGMARSVNEAQAGLNLRTDFYLDAATAPGNTPALSGLAITPEPGTTRLTLPNRHLEYAITWFGLAATLVFVFVAFAVTVRREGRGTNGL